MAKGKKKATKAVAKKVVEQLPEKDPAKAKELKELESIVDKGWDSFINVGQALARIRDEGLYFHAAKPAKSFSGYLLERWGNRMAGYRHINAYQIHGLLVDSGIKPEAHLHTEAEYLKLAKRVNLDNVDESKGKLAIETFKKKIADIASKGKDSLDYNKLKEAVGIPPKAPIVREAKMSETERISAFQKKLLAQIETKIKAWKAKDMSVSLGDIVKGLR